MFRQQLLELLKLGMTCLVVVQDDQTYITCVLALEELGATGNLGLSQIALNPVIAAGIGGLATSATAQATVEVCNPLCSLSHCICAPSSRLPSSGVLQTADPLCGAAAHAAVAAQE